jgi:High potential iron-sulfur protein
MRDIRELSKGSSMDQSKLSRRRFISQVAVAVPVSTVMLRQTARAQDAPPVTADDPTAKALLYVEDAANVDTTNPLAARYTAGQNCANCLQSPGPAGSGRLLCNLFPGKSVAEGGWCTAWAAKP